MNQSTLFDVEGVVVENLPNTYFRVKITSDTPPELSQQLLLCRMAGRMRRNFVRILPGDKVRLEVSSLDLSKGRIVYRLK